MQDIRKIVYLEPCIIKEIDNFRKNYAMYYRGQVVNMCVGLFGLISLDEQRVYFEKALSYIEDKHIRTSFNKSGYKRNGNVSIQMHISNKQYALFEYNDDKIIIIAALLYVHILN